jgi:trk system potassium uptake protein TrkH
MDVLADLNYASASNHYRLAIASRCSYNRTLNEGGLTFILCSDSPTLARCYLSIGKGQATVTWRARPQAVIRALMSQCYVLAVVTGVPAFFAIFENHGALAAALIFPCIVFIIIGYFAQRWPPPTDLRNIEAVCTLSGIFLLIILSPVPAFMVLDMSILDAFFEATSGTTSTGLSVASNASSWPITGHVLRGWMQWVGGFAIALAGVATIIGPRSAVKKMGEFDFEQQDILSSARQQARNLLKVYCGITIISFALLMAVLPTWWEALVISLAAVSTGGFTPRADSLASYSNIAQILVIFICLTTTVSMFFYVVLYRDGLRKALDTSSTKAVAVGAVIGTILASILVILTSEPSGETLLNSVLNFLSGFTTAGFSVSPIDTTSANTALILAAMIVGGAAGSTAGGIKIDRAITLLKMLQISINRLRAPPHAVFRLKEYGQWVAQERIVSLIAVLTCYGLTLIISWIIFIASGQPAFESLFDIVSALSTVGLSTGLTGPDTPSHLKVVLICAMLLGRLEFLALLATLSPFTWLKRS